MIISKLPIIGWSMNSRQFNVGSFEPITIRKKLATIIWEVVFHLPRESAESTVPWFDASNLRPVTKNSLEIIVIVIHAGIIFSWVRIMNTALVKILSTKGSINFPKSVTNFNFLAMCPSKKSVSDAIKKNKIAKDIEINFPDAKLIEIKEDS